MASAQELAAVFRLKDEFSSEAEHIERRLGGLEDHLGTGMTRAAVAGAAGVTVLIGVLAAAGSQALELGKSFDDAYDRIRIGTGKTEDELQSLQSSFRTVVADVPSSFEAISKAITETNQRLDLTGATLEERATQFANLSRITGGDLSENIRSGAKAFQEWKIATDDQSGALDKVFRATQITGESTSTLFQQLQQAGPTFRQLGLGFDESLSVLAKWNKEGVDSGRIMAALRVGVANLNESGLPVPETFRAITQQIHDMDDGAAATGLAIQVFGRRAGPELAEAIRAGRLSAGEFFDQIARGGDTIEQASRDTDDAAQRWQQSANRIALAFEPAGDAAFETANKVAEHLTPAFEQWARDAAPLIAGSSDVIIGSLDAIGQASDRLVEKIGDVARAVKFGIQTPELPESDGTRTVPSPLGGGAEDYLRNKYGGRGLPGQVADSVERETPEAAGTVERSAEEVVNAYFGRVNELFATSLDEARLRSSLGASGAALASALQTAWEKPLDAAARAAVAGAEAALEDEIKRTFGAQRGKEMSEYLSGLVAGSLAGGAGSEQQGALTDYLAGLRPRIEAQTEVNRQAEQAQRDAETAQRQANQRAKQEAEAAVREAERIAQQHADLLRQYARTAEQLAPEIAAAYGQVGQRALAALDDAFQEGASGGAGTGLARSLTDLAHQARDAGLPAWEETWRQLVAVGQQAIEEGTPAARAAAEQMIREVNEAIQAANTLTPENFAAALGTAQLATSMGSQGAAIADGLKRGLDEGGKATIETLGRTVESMRVTLLQNPNLSPERAHELFAEVFAQVNAAIADGSAEALDQLRQFLRDFDFATELEAIGNRAAERGNAAIIQAQQGITQAYANRDEAIKRLYTNQAIQEYDRSQQQAEEAWISGYLSDTQKYVEGEKAKLQANRERAQTERAELRETADLEKSYQEQREALLAKRQATETSSFGTFRAAGAQAQTVSPHQAPGDAIAQQLRDLDTQHTKDMANLKARQDQRRADRAEDSKWAAEDKAAVDALNTILANAQKSASTINQDFRDTYQLNVIIPRQVNELMRNTDTEVAKLNQTLSDQLSTYQTETNTAISRWQYLHDTLLPDLTGGFDKMLDGAIADQERLNALMGKGGGTGGTSNADNLPPPPPPTELPDFGISTGGQTLTAPEGAGGGSGAAPTIIVQNDFTNAVIGVTDIDTHIVDTVNEAARFGKVRV